MLENWLKINFADCFYHTRIIPRFSNAWKWKVKVKLLSCVWLFATPWTAAHQAPSPMGFSRQEHWSGLPFPSPMHEREKWKWSRVWLLATPWTAAHQAPPSMGFSRQEYWSGVPLPSPIVLLVFSFYKEVKQFPKSTQRVRAGCWNLNSRLPNWSQGPTHMLHPEKPPDLFN